MALSGDVNSTIVATEGPPAIPLPPRRSGGAAEGNYPQEYICAPGLAVVRQGISELVATSVKP